MKWTPIESKITGPQGEFEVSTVRLFAGGETDNRPDGSPFSLSDYAEENPWPFETMVFKPRSSTGIYHEPYSSGDEAKEGHKRIVERCIDGTLPIGHGVTGVFGTPSITAEEWKLRAVKV